MAPATPDGDTPRHRLKSAVLRVTAPRLAVLSWLVEHPHTTAEQDRLRGTDPARFSVRSGGVRRAQRLRQGGLGLVPGIGPSPDKMLLGRLFAYPDAHRYRIGPNYLQLPVNAPHSPVNSYSKDGAMRYTNTTDPVYAPNSYGGPHADPQVAGEAHSAYGATGEVLRSAYSLHSEDDDFGQPGTLVRTVLNDDQRSRLVENVSGHLSNGVTTPVQEGAFEYWRNVDKTLGDRIAAQVQTS
jgi:catalase